MKCTTAIATLSSLSLAFAAALPRGTPAFSKIQILEPKYFKDLGAKRVKITYGPYTVPGMGDPQSHGMLTFNDKNAQMPCHDCFVTSFTADLQYEDGTIANANNKMWLHHNGLMNLNRTDAACETWPERMSVNGNERSAFDYTLKGTRKAGYYIKKGDVVFLTTDVMNMDMAEKKVNMVMEWEYIDGTPAGFDVVIPIWLDVRGNCLEGTYGINETDLVFTTKGGSGWTSKHNGDMILMVPHIHDGNAKQDISMNGKLVCESIPGYGETEGYVSHEESEGHHHDHGTGEHIYHVSSISQCTNIGKVAPGDRFTITSSYDMKQHPGMKDPDGSLEPIMAIQFLHLARPQAEGLKDVLASPPGDLQAFLNQIERLRGKKAPDSP